MSAKIYWWKKVYVHCNIHVLIKIEISTCEHSGLVAAQTYISPSDIGLGVGSKYQRKDNVDQKYIVHNSKLIFNLFKDSWGKEVWRSEILTNGNCKIEIFLLTKIYW